MDAESESVAALQDCMRFLGLRMNDYVPVQQPALLRVLTGGSGVGPLDVTFWNQPHKGPQITVDDTMSGFGIRYVEFVPRFQAFAFREVDGVGELTVTNRRSPVYAFVLTFRKG